MNKVELTKKEKGLVNSFIGSGFAIPDDEVELFNLVRFLNATKEAVLLQQEDKETLSTIDSIKDKIRAKMDLDECDREIEKLLSTKAESYNKTKATNKGAVANLVYQTISNNGPITRSDIAERAGIRVATVCARVKELLDEGRIIVSGEVKDLDTNRRVQLLSIRKNYNE